MTERNDTQQSLEAFTDGGVKETSDDDGDDGEGEGESKRVRYSGIGGGRRRVLDAIDEKDRLEPLESPESIDELTDALEEISLENGYGILSPPEKAIEAIERAHEWLPEEAREHYIRDETLLGRINMARKRFNTWLGRRKREAKMPGPYEAGPSNYPTKKLRKRQRSERNAKEELDEALERVRSGANGGKQRALKKIGSSVAEVNEEREKDQKAEYREMLEPGQILQYRNPRLHVATIKRVNKKSVRLIRPNPRAGGTKPMSDEPEPEYRKETVKLRPSALKCLIRREDYEEELETVREFHEEIPADYDEAIEWLSGGEVSADG